MFKGTYTAIVTPSKLDKSMKQLFSD